MDKTKIWILASSIVMVGILALGWFVVGLRTGWSVSQSDDVVLTDDGVADGAPAGAE